MKSILQSVLVNFTPASLLCILLIAGACKKPAEDKQQVTADSTTGDGFVQIFDGETLNG